MSIVTKTGDGGLTSLWSGERVRKDDPRVEAYGTLDELSSQLGLARHSARLASTLDAIDALQRDLVRAGGELASRGKPFVVPISGEDIDAVTAATRLLEEKIPLTGFVLPGMTPGSASLDVARAVARRAERRVLSLAREADVSVELRVWLNRLSDWLFMLARAEEAAEGKLRFAPPAAPG
ncbi:MAG TPA: cob(I)yrinic acid a,c-diamide adenosyltransferase [Rectinemataceae bacterium]|nr:cob(I)yrinic acid a,c-diamide adenosyltransferase [Rectinemataceae bacterium]